MSSTEPARLYGLRQRHIKRGFRSGADGGDAVSTAARRGAAVATVAVGLKPGEMTKLERQLFGSRMKNYLTSRDKIVVKWFEDCTQPVDLVQLLADEPDSSAQTLRDAYYFLQGNGYINFGVLKERPTPVEEAEEGDAQLPEAPVEDDKAIAFKLYELLREADMETTSEKALRKQLQQFFKTDMNEKKAFIKEQVNHFIQNLERKDSLEPLGFEGQSALTEQQQREQKKAAAQARRALAAPPPKPTGRVIVVGAGPAGLAAATQLQRNNVDVLVLEARDRVGGRVHSYQDAGFSAPVDLGASLITGTEPDAEQGLGPDPVSFVCKQLGIQLHVLGGALPLFGEAGQMVEGSVDEYVDRLRDELLDTVQQAAEAGPQEEVLQQSLGQALDAALHQKLKAAQQDETKEVQEPPRDAAAGASSADGGDHLQEAAAADKVAVEGTSSGQELAAVADKDTADAMPSGQEPAVAADKDTADGTSPGQEPAAAQADDAQAADRSLPITPEMLRVLDWHWANLEYGCSASLHEVSLPHWNQDEEWGGFGGPHAMVVGGFDGTCKGLAAQLGDNLRLSCPVSSIHYAAAEQQGEDGQADSQQQPVKVVLASGEELEAALVLVTVPLGVLQAGSVEFVPPLPEWKTAAAQKLGFGDLNKVIMQFPEVFWDPEVDYFGITQQQGEDTRGRCFMFWNLARFNGGIPLLAALVSGRSAVSAESADTQDLQQHMLQTLRRVYGSKVCDPVAVKVTQWASDEFSKGSYSYVAVGCTGKEYESLALPVARCVLFAGEHTCREHPDSVGGAMLSGLREAARCLQLLQGPDGAAVADLVASRTQTISKTDKRKRAAEAAEAAGSRPKKAKRDKKDKKDKERRSKEKQRGEGKGKARTQKERSSSEEEDEESDGDQRGSRKGAGAGRQRRAQAAQEDTMKRYADKQALREELTRLWSGLLDAQQGDCLTVLDVMRNCDSLDSRQQVMTAAVKASPQALSHLAADAVFLSTLNTWLADLVLERSDANLHVLLKLLELLAALKAATWSSLTSSGLCLTVKKVAGHRNKEVMGKGSALLREWELRDPSKNKAPAAKTPRLSGSAVLSSILQIGPQQRTLPQERLQQQQHSQQRTQQPRAQQQQQASAAVPNGNGARTEQLEKFMSDAEKERLAAQQAALQEAEAQAAAAAAELAALQAAPAPAPIRHARIESFGEFARSSKRQREGGDEEPEGHKHQKHNHKHSSKHKSKEQESHGAAAGADVADAPTGLAEAKANATKHLSDFIKLKLKPRFQAKEVDNDDCKWVLQKVVAKVMDATTGADTTAERFMTAKREAKVTSLIESYVSRRKAEKVKGSAKSSASSLPAGKVSTTARTP